MMTTHKRNFADELDAISARYESQFAGMARSSRNLDEIDAIIADTKSVLSRIESIPEAVRPPELAELATLARQNVALYERERTLIVEAKRVGPDFERFAQLASSANFVFARYRRHFAGQARATRDLGLLAELADDLESIEGGMAEVVSTTKSADFKKDLELVRQSVKMYRSEREAILEARKEGTADERASLMAQLANSQFGIYQNHFAGKSRATRRPALLVRIIEQLEAIQKGMRALEGKVSGDNNKKNLGIVAKQLETYRAELDEVRNARKTTSFADLMGMLGGAANEVFDAFRKEFAGQDRKTRDAARLGALCDELGDIRKQMVDLGRAEQSATNDSNIDIVTGQLTSFEQEWEQISLAQK
ncbi:MAG TPA: hypothetical protein VLM85_13615 [Polyangiaceae bacterium]|nr:hypothetical protein [Polyangiaceae bacterium]